MVEVEFQNCAQTKFTDSLCAVFLEMVDLVRLEICNSALAEKQDDVPDNPRCRLVRVAISA